MARTWLSIRVELVSGHGADLWPRPGRVFAAARSHSFAEFATAIDLAFGRWDLAHLHLFTLSDGTRVSPLDWWDDEAPDGTVDGHATKLSRLQAGEQFAYVFDMGDGWAHLVHRGGKAHRSPRRARRGTEPPGSLLGLGQPPRPIRTPLGRG
jgi:Plasmid pRiA4b ORF-3-like protein